MCPWADDEEKKNIYIKKLMKEIYIKSERFGVCVTEAEKNRMEMWPIFFSTEIINGKKS